jgi:glycosyltransferase involved in cell wall biosynthesis
MVFVNLTDGNFGIGVVGHNLVGALSRLTDTQRISPGRAPEDRLPGPLLERFYSPRPSFVATRHVAYIVFENDLEVARSQLKTRCRYDVLAAASRWCEDSLRAAGLTAVTTIHHGVDTVLFNSQRAGRDRCPNRFAVFSGGKFEYRKAQDIVARAFQLFSEKHDDVELVAAWHPWSLHASTMCASRHVPWSRCSDEGGEETIRHWLHGAGVDLRRVTLVPRVSNEAMAAIYGATHVGLFPSRCEGATNLMMMEYMACGGAVIATDFGGHRDILTSKNSIPLRKLRPARVARAGAVVGCWCEPDVDELVARLEEAYHDRDRLIMLRKQAAQDMAQWTWDDAARCFLDVLNA